MRKILLTVSILCTHIAVLTAQSTNHSQILIDLLAKDDCFRAREYYKLYNDSLVASVETFYQYKMNGFLNRPDSSAMYLERLLDNHPDFISDGNARLEYINKLIDIYSETDNYINLVKAYDRAEHFIHDLPPGSYEDTWKTTQIAALEQYRSEARSRIHLPKSEVIRDKYKDNISVDIQKELYVSTVAEFNGIAKRAVIDTGCAYSLFISKDFADQCGFRELPSQTDSINVNGVMVRGTIAMVDSVRIGNILIINVPAVVIHDNYSLFISNATMLSKELISRYDSMQSFFDVAIGLPVLKKLGSIEFDWEKDKMNLKTKSEVAISSREPNVYTKSNALYLDVLINGIDFAGILDTGSLNLVIDLNQQFYTENSANLPINPLLGEKEGMVGVLAFAAPVKNTFLLDPKVEFDSKILKLKQGDVSITWFNNSEEIPVSISLFRYGGMGNKFLERLGNKVTLDFVNMRINAE